MARIKDRKIVLENGMEFYGVGFGEHRDAICELVFNTSMVGYQEIVVRPVVYGPDDRDELSAHRQLRHDGRRLREQCRHRAAGMIVREC